MLQNSSWAVSFILLITLFVFSNIFSNQFVLDDFDFIVRWPLIQDMRNLPRFFVGYIPPDGQPGIYSPLKTFWHAINFNLWQYNVFGYHLAALGIHALGILFVYLLTYELLNRRETAFWTALLFALHPVHVEAVTFMTASVDTLGIVFLLASFYFYLSANRHQGLYPVFWGEGKSWNNIQDKRSLKNEEPQAGKEKGLAFGFAFLAVFTHELAISLPLLFAFYELFFTRNRPPFRESLLKLLPYFLLVLVYVFCKWQVLGTITRGGYLMGSYLLTFWVIVKAWARYVSVLIFPWQLTHNPVLSPGIFAFDQDDFDATAVLSQSVADPYVLRALAVIVIVLLSAFFAGRKRPLVGFCAGWLFLSLLPGANIVPSSVYFAERYLYPGSWAFCLLLGYAFVKLSDKALSSDRLWLRRTVSGGMAVILIFYAARTWIRNKDWRDNPTLYETVVRDNPQSAFMHNNLGIVYAEEGQWEQALDAFKKAISLNPEEAHFYFSIAPVYFESGLLNESVKAYRRAIELNPEFAEAYFNLAGVYAHLGEEENIREMLNHAVLLFKRQGRIVEAGELLLQVQSFLQGQQDRP